MSLVLKINPIGIDAIIARLQKRLFSSLSSTWNIAADRFNCHPRCYRNQTTDNGYVAELYVGGNEYNETYLNDLVDVTSFFGLDIVEQVAQDNVMTANVHLVFFADLSKIKPGNDRNDEEARIDVQKIIDTYGTAMGFLLIKSSTGIDLCLKEYPGTRKEAGLKYRDMHPFHVFRFDMQVFYQPTQTKC
jgi:hypothetical protein